MFISIYAASEIANWHGMTLSVVDRSCSVGIPWKDTIWRLIDPDGYSVDCGIIDQFERLSFIDAADLVDVIQRHRFEHKRPEFSGYIHTPARGIVETPYCAAVSPIA